MKPEYQKDKLWLKKTYCANVRRIVQILNLSSSEVTAAWPGLTASIFAPLKCFCLTVCFVSVLISGLFSARLPTQQLYKDKSQRDTAFQTDTARYICVCAVVCVCVCVCLSSGRGPNLYKTSPWTTHTQTQSQHKLPPWSNFLPATASAESPAVYKTHPQKWSHDFQRQ